MSDEMRDRVAEVSMEERAAWRKDAEASFLPNELKRYRDFLSGEVDARILALLDALAEAEARGVKRAADGVAAAMFDYADREALEMDDDGLSHMAAFVRAALTEERP